MSLLLDALKKAADEKKKVDDEVVDKVPEQALVDEVDLNLELEEELAEEFPQVNEEIVKPASEVEEQSFRTETPVTKTEAVGAADKIELALENEPVEEEKSESSQQSSELDKQPDANARPFRAVNTHLADRHVEIKNEKALSALINKGNQASQMSRKKSQRAVISIILLLFVTVSGFLYVQIADSEETVRDITAIEKPEVETKPVQAVEQVMTEVMQTVINKQKPDLVESTAKASSKVVAQKKPSVTARAKTQNKITILHKQVDDPIDVLVRKAYAAFNRDELKQSESLYQQVIHRDAKNRDALLGLAAIAVKQQRFEYARQKYTQLLKLNPKDSFARAGLSSVENQNNARFNESRLKLMISDEPDAAHLYFALGNLYAAESRWPEAQTAYFSAWSAANTNSDYAYNLAVSLDHLGKLNNAKDFYSLSLKLQQASGGNIPVEDIKIRISAIGSSDHE